MNHSEVVARKIYVNLQEEFGDQPIEGQSWERLVSPKAINPWNEPRCRFAQVMAARRRVRDRGAFALAAWCLLRMFVGAALYQLHVQRVFDFGKDMARLEAYCSE